MMPPSLAHRSYIAEQTGNPVRFVGLSTALANAQVGAPSLQHLICLTPHLRPLRYIALLSTRTRDVNTMQTRTQTDLYVIQAELNGQCAAGGGGWGVRVFKQ